MKDSKVRSSIVPVTMSRLPNVTRSLNCEITVLSTEAEAKESYILDVENSLRLNKQASNIMFGEQIMKMKGQGKLLGRFRSVSWENMRLLEELSKERRSKEEVLAEVLLRISRVLSLSKFGFNSNNTLKALWKKEHRGSKTCGRPITTSNTTTV